MSMKKNKGMKIYKQRRRRKGSDSQVLSILGTCAVVFGVGIFGYYVVAVPVWQLVKSMGESPQTVISDSAEISENAVSETTAETETEADAVYEGIQVYDNSEDVAVTSVLSESESAPAVTTVSEAVTEAVTTAAVTQPPVQAVVKGGCCYLSVSDILSLDALMAKLNSVEGCTSAAVPLKTTGGYVNYASSVNTANLSGAVSSSLSLYDIVKAITEKGLTPVAEISTVADNIYPRTYKKSAYQFDDGYTGEWLDNKAESGGKPWLSPFASEAQEYLSALVEEITAAGIKSVICTDNYFPPFREKDLGYIGEIVKSETRYKGLTDLVNMLNSKAASNGGKVMLSVNAEDVINGTAEVFKPEEFGSMSLVVNIDMNSFSGETLHSVLNKLDAKKGGMKLVPCIITEGQSQSWIDSSVSTIKSAGYDLYMIK